MSIQTRLPLPDASGFLSLRDAVPEYPLNTPIQVGRVPENTRVIIRNLGQLHPQRLLSVRNQPTTPENSSTSFAVKTPE